MTNVLIILCHPGKTSLNHSVKQIIEENLKSVGIEVTQSILYEEIEKIRQKSEEFIHEELNKIRKSEIVIFQFPTYFVSFPALLQDYIFLILLKNPQCLDGKKVLISSTFGGTRGDYSEGGCRGSLDKVMGELYEIVFGKCECEFLQPIQFFRDEYEVEERFERKINWIGERVRDIEKWKVKQARLEEEF